MKEFEEILDRIVREEYGGCDPSADNPCILEARVRDNMIQVFVVGKWRYVARAGRKYPPSKKMQSMAERTTRINTGKTFQGKDIVFDWEEREPETPKAPPTPADIRNAIDIILSDTKSYSTSLSYAVNRCQWLLDAPEHEYKDRIIRILGDITHWRHPQAREVRETLKRFMKEG